MDQYLSIRGERGKNRNQTSTSDVSLNTDAYGSARRQASLSFHQELQVDAPAFVYLDNVLKMVEDTLKIDDLLPTTIRTKSLNNYLIYES